MNGNSYLPAAWAAVAAAVALVLEVSLTLAHDAGQARGVLAPAAVFLFLKTGLGAYATWRFRDYLAERFDFHGVDRLVLLMIGGGIGLALAVTVARLLPEAADSAVTMSVLLLLGLTLGAATMLFGYRLLSVDGEIGGLKRPFAYLNIAMPLCFVTVLLAPLGLLMMAASLVLMAMILFRSPEDAPEFV